MKMYLISSPTYSLALLGLLAVLFAKSSEQCTVNIVNNADGDLALDAFDGGDVACLIPSSDGTIGPVGQLSCSMSSSSCKIREPSFSFCQNAINVPCYDYLIYYNDADGNLESCISSTNKCGGRLLQQQQQRRRARVARRTAAAAAAAGKSTATSETA